ncbi:hypothetical protein SCUCBS95973_007418 [Sporothrix curviconia]|uniref:Cytochrome P450 monooxygenase n=1 Tax=Sporothrix curviconia TaxID=1260050 RepID=A0ABP0CEZ1_9PEZI
MAMTTLLATVLARAALYGSITLALFGLVRLLYLIFVYPDHVSPLRHLPGPKDHHVFLGQLLNQFRAADPEQPYTAWMQTWPNAPLIRYRETGVAAEGLLINSAAAYRDVMCAQHCYAYQRSAPFRRLIGDIIGVGLVFAEGEEHRRQRKALGGLFTVANVKAYLAVLQEKADCLVDEIQCSVSSAAAGGGSGGSGGGLVEIKSLFAQATLDVIGIVALGQDLHCLGGRSVFQACYEAMFDLTPAGMLLAAVNLVVPIRWLPLEANRSFMQASAQLRQILTSMTEERIAQVVAAGEKPNKSPAKGLPAKDLLTYMVETKYLATNVAERWSKADLVEQVLNFMATGHETTAGALTFAVHRLGVHSEVVRKLRSEARDRLPSCPSFSDIDSLPYLDAVLRECLRFHPPVAGIPRVAQQDTVVAGQFVPRGTTLMPVPAVMHHNTALWGDDAHVFRPERWIDDPTMGGAVNSEAYAWVGFGHGPRSCIGRALAALNFKVVLLAMVQKLDWTSLDRGKLPVVNPSGQLRPKGEVWLQVAPVREAK